MKKPEPQLGQIIRFDYLWYDEHRRGREEGSKERPCGVILAAQKSDDGTQAVFIAPITHSPPKADQIAIEIPAQANTITGLDDQTSWLITSEVNKVDWNDPGIVPARKDKWLMGQLPRGIAQRALSEIREMAKTRALKSISRL
jgi:hypothetical protein